MCWNKATMGPNKYHPPPPGNSTNQPPPSRNAHRLPSLKLNYNVCDNVMYWTKCHTRTHDARDYHTRTHNTHMTAVLSKNILVLVWYKKPKRWQMWRCLPLMLALTLGVFSMQGPSLSAQSTVTLLERKTIQTRQSPLHMLIKGPLPIIHESCL